MADDREIFMSRDAGSKLWVARSRAGDEIVIGITNTFARTGVAQSLSRIEAQALVDALGRALATEEA